MLFIFNPFFDSRDVQQSMPMLFITIHGTDLSNRILKAFPHKINMLYWNGLKLSWKKHIISHTQIYLTQIRSLFRRFYFNQIGHHVIGRHIYIYIYLIYIHIYTITSIWLFHKNISLVWLSFYNCIATYLWISLDSQHCLCTESTPPCSM